MKLKCLGLFLILPLASLPSLAAIPDQVNGILNQIEENNSEIKLAKKNFEYKEQGVTAAKSYLYPTLGLTAIYNKGSSLSNSLPDMNLSGYGSTNSSIGSSTSVAQTNEGWNTSLSTNYYLFSGFVISDGIDRALRDLRGSEFKFKSQILTQKSLYLQALLEWQWLNKVQVLLKNASEVFKKVETHKNKSQILYTEDDDQIFDERKSYVEYQLVRLEEGKKLVEAFLMTSLPSVQIASIVQLPQLQLSYKIPSDLEIESKYKDQSLSRKSFDLDYENALGVRKVLNWQKPYIPTVMLTGSASKSGTASETSNQTNWSTQILFTFNFFDGLGTTARNNQAIIGVESTRIARDLETDKKILFLRHQAMKAKVSQAEYRYKKSFIKNKEIRFKDVQNKFKQGIATELELTLSAIDLAKTQQEALDSWKDYQSAAMSIATELNDWENVDVTID